MRIRPGTAADFDAMLELFAEDVVVYVAPPNFESGTYEGRATYRALIERWGAPWSEMRIEPLSMEPAGDWILALDKPAGLAVHGGSGVAHGVIESLRAARPEARFLELVHRLDRETSGVLLIAIGVVGARILRRRAA